MYRLLGYGETAVEYGADVEGGEVAEVDDFGAGGGEGAADAGGEGGAGYGDGLLEVGVGGYFCGVGEEVHGYGDGGCGGDECCC